MKEAMSIEAAIVVQAEIERRMKTLRVSPTTVILVPEEKCNDEYREWYRVNRMGFRPSCNKNNDKKINKTI